MSLLPLLRRSVNLTRTRSLSRFVPTRSAVPRLRSYASQNTPSGARDRSALGVFTPTSAAVFVATGIGLFYYFKYEKEKLLEQRKKEHEEKSVGKAHIGGPFALTTSSGEPFTEKNLAGKWSFVYFGFTNCPDICPAELDKMGEVLTELEKEYKSTPFQSVFITVDPVRDSLPQISRYLSDFHPTFIGLSGTYGAIKSVCKAYRVYFSTPPNADPQGDYLVDHSIFVYLINPNGEFVEAFGQVVEKDAIVERVKKEIGKWNSANP